MEHGMGPRKSASTTASAVSVFGALCLLTGSGVFLSAQIASPVAQPRCPAEPAQVKGACSLTLLPGEMKRLRFAVAQGNVEMLAAEQVEGAIELQLSRTAAGDASSQPPAIYTNQAGRHSSIRILLTPDRLTPDRQVTVGNASKDKPATVVLTLGAERSADANSALEQAAEEAFARAELLRVQDTQDKTAALKSYDQAIADWRKAANQPELARALIWKADFIVNNQGDAVLASPVIAQASGLLPLLEDIEAAHYWQVVAFVNVVQGNYTAVQDAYGAALALYEKAGDASHQAKVLDNAARVELMEGHADKARHEEQNAAELAGKAGDVRRQAFVQEELGAIYSTVGDSESAYRAYGQALAQMKLLPPEPRMQAALWVDFSDLYTTLGDFGRVKDALDQAMEIWKSTDYPIGLVDTLNNYGDLYIEKGQPSTAREYLSRGLDLSEKVHYERGSIALMSGIGESYLYERDTVRAEDFLNRALARAKEANQTDSETKIECHLGDLAMLKRDYKQAGEHYELCRKESVATEDTYSEIRSEGGLARSAFASGALDDAQSRCEQALGGIEATRGLLRNQDLRTSFFASQHAYYDLDIQILERLDQEHHNEGYGWQAFLIAERGRARTLLDQVATANADRPAASPALLAQYEDVQRRLRRLETGAARPRQAHGSQAANPTPAAMARLTLSEHQLHQEILGSGKTDEAAAASPALTLASLEHTLPDRRSALVEYWIGETASYAWIITRSGIRTFRLPSALQLDWKCSAFRKALLTTASPDPHLTAEQRAAMEPVYQGRQRKLGLKLSQTLLPPGILSPSTSTVFIVGDGPIESIPFAALPDSSSARTPRIRLRNVTFLNEPSAAIFSVLEKNLPSQHPLRLAIFTMGQSSADVRNGDIRDALAEASRNHPPEFSALPFAGDEAAMIRETMGTNAAHLFPADSLSPAALAKLDWNEFSIGHFAMHAVLNERYAELTGLALGRKQASAPAEMLWYGDISHLRTRLDLVVLSACNTAMGERIPGEGLRGLTQAFFASGSQRVLGTLWEVDDQATSEWMRHFYQALKATHSPALALHRTQETMAADPQWSSPYYWAGFVLAGDWRPLP
jgi:CHAT domain-containing protein/tetratricopeptide (TPR) repeat protein